MTRRHLGRLLAAGTIAALLVSCGGGAPGRGAARPADLAPPAAAPTTAAPPPTATERAALRAAAYAAYEAKDFSTCVAAFGRLAEVAPWMPSRATASWKAAACAARAGDTATGLARMRDAVAAGLRDLTALQDADLAALRGPAWDDLVAGIRRNDAAWRTTINLDLLAIYEADQADRQGSYESIDWTVVTPRDQDRERRVAALIDAGGARSADDYYHAAMVYQHGDTVEQIERARQYALRAIELEPAHARARWLAAAAEDRVLMYGDKPQRWGTQYRKDGGRWILHPVDGAVTDDDRAEWNVPSLAEAEAQADALNGL